MAQMIRSGSMCDLCLVAAAISVWMVGLSLFIDRSNFRRLTILLPIAIGLGALSNPAVSRDAISKGESRPVRITIYTQPECPYCDELQNSVMPGITREFGGRVAVEIHPADELPGVRRTPTILLQSARAGVTPRVVEGLPTVDRLRGVIRDLEAAP
jgi:hypothetical protein